MAISYAAKNAIDFVIGNDEGGWVYTNRKDDLGGPTYAGVAGKWFVKWYNKKYPNKGIDINSFINVFSAYANDGYWNELIYEFYYDEFYKPIRGDGLPEQIRAVVLSAMVNVGADEAPYWLQSSLNDYGKILLRKPGTEFMFLKIDGKIGPKTVQLLNDINPNDIDEIINIYCLDYWLPKYIRKVTKSPDQLGNLKGWYNRVRRYIIV